MPEPFEIFGPVVAPPKVERAIESVAREWLPTYVSVVRQSEGLDLAEPFKLPQSYQNSFDFKNYLEWPLPAFIVVCSGTPKGYERGEGGEIGAAFAFEAAVLLEDTKEESARKSAGMYATAIALMLEQRGSLNKLSADTLTTKIETKLPVPQTRTLVLGHVTGETFVNNMMNKYFGPPIGTFPGEIPGTPFEEPTTPYPPLEPVETVDSEVIGLPLEQ